MFRVKLLSENGKLPVKGSELAAGYDLFSSENTVLNPGEYKLISTDISVALPQGCYGRIAPRSGLAVKNGIDVLAGVIDADYRGQVKVALINHEKNKPFVITIGDRIAQLILERYVNDCIMVRVDELDDTQRGQGGFGSTGL